MHHEDDEGVGMKASRRIAERKLVEGIEVYDLTSLSNYTVIARHGQIINASRSGFLVQINRTALIPTDLRESLSLHSIVGQSVVLYLPQMNLDLDGTVIRANHTGKGQFVIAIDFSTEVPEYWRECLVDLLPAPGELENEETRK